MSLRQLIISTLFLTGCLWAFTLTAQKKGGKKVVVPRVKIAADTVQEAKQAKNFLPDVFLGHSDFKGGVIKKSRFDSLLKQGLFSHDESGNRYQILDFNFTYGERNLYEDSLANLQVITDYLLEYCPGDTVSRGISSTIYERTKAGDTIFIDKIHVARLRDNQPDSVTILGRPLKCVVVK